MGSRVVMSPHPGWLQPTCPSPKREGLALISNLSLSEVRELPSSERGESGLAPGWG